MIQTQMINNKIEPFDSVFVWSKFQVPLRGYSFGYKTIRTSQEKAIQPIEGDLVQIEESLVSFLPTYTLFYGTVLHEAGIGRRKIQYNENLAQIMQMAFKQELMEKYSTRSPLKVRVEDLPRQRAIAMYITREMDAKGVLGPLEEDFSVMKRVLNNVLSINL